jgi:site-specific recombinase XerD
MKKYEKFEKKCQEIRADNEKILEEFEEWLEKSGASARTISKHSNNVEFFINEFLLSEDATPAKEGSNSVNMFLGYWFIKKAGWSSESALRGNASSLKKFYQFLFEKGETTQEDLDELSQTIKIEMPRWLGNMERYDDPDIEEMTGVWQH